MSDSEWIAFMTEQYGRKTINEMRSEVGLPSVVGGEWVYVDYLKTMLGLPLRPSLTVVPCDGYAGVCGGGR